ncbi:MAG TPA: SCO family protein [Candidatus Dormibacteraeota bacterium]|nr:SCO family protein [Candidatus Dormibacteraeota bacterium]
MEAETHSPGFWGWFRDRWLVVAAVGTVVALATALLTATIFAPKGNPAIRAPGFELLDQQGRPTSLSQFRGKVVVLTFIDPYCTQICPLTTQSMLQALRLLGPAAAANVQLLGINANPDKTRISDVAFYTRAHDMDGRWRFLTGTRAQLEEVWRGYHVYVAAVGNHIDHEAVVYLIGRRGRERAVYSTPMSYGDVGEQAQMLAKAIARLLPSRPAVLREASLEQNSPLVPAETATLPALGAGHSGVVLGKAHAHLLCFFASWLGETTNLPAQLAGLDAYGVRARRNGWPAPVAVDELATETSAAAARKLFEGMAATLDTPIVEDASGRLADGYQVEELPWYVLTSRSGKILWRHDGWLSPAKLIAGVRGALAAR